MRRCTVAKQNKEQKLSVLGELLLAGLGLLSSGRGELRKAVDRAVREGKLKQKEGQKLFKNLSKKTEKQRSEVKEVVEEEISKALSKIGIATPQEVNRLLHQVERMESKAEKVHRAKKKQKKNKVSAGAEKQSVQGAAPVAASLPSPSPQAAPAENTGATKPDSGVSGS